MTWHNTQLNDRPESWFITKTRHKYILRPGLPRARKQILVRREPFQGEGSAHVQLLR